MDGTRRGFVQPRVGFVWLLTWLAPFILHFHLGVVRSSHCSLLISPGEAGTGFEDGRDECVVSVEQGGRGAT